MNVFDIPELTITEEFREQVVLDAMTLNKCTPFTSNVQGSNKLQGTGAVWFPEDKQYFESVYEQFILKPEVMYLFFMDIGYNAEPHIDSEAYKLEKHGGDSISPHFSADSYAGLRKTVVQIPLTPTGDDYARLTYQNEFKAWTDHAFAFTVEELHGVDVTKHMRLNLQIPFNIPIKELYQIYKSGNLVRT